MELLIILFAVMAIGIVGIAANEIGVDSRDGSDGRNYREPTGIA